MQSGPGRAYPQDRDDFTAVVDDDDLVTNNEVLMSAPCRIDLDQCRHDFDNAHVRGNHGPDAQREVDIVHARYVTAGEDGLLNMRTLLCRQVHAAGLTGRAAASLARGLPLLALVLLRRLLTLLTLGSLTGGVVLLALLGLALLGLLRLLALILATLGLACGLV